MSLYRKLGPPVRAVQNRGTQESQAEITAEFGPLIRIDGGWLYLKNDDGTQGPMVGDFDWVVEQTAGSCVVVPQLDFPKAYLPE